MPHSLQSSHRGQTSFTILDKSFDFFLTAQCPFCVRAKALLQAKGLPYEEVDVSTDTERLQEMIKRSGKRTVPQIFINGNAIGGFQELSQMNAKGDL